MFHVLNRSVARLTIFENPADYDAFLWVIDEVWDVVPLPIFLMILMPNHWHFVVRSTTDDQVGGFFGLLSVMHTIQYHAHYKSSRTGHLYQGRFESFPIQSDEHLLIAMRYLERNPVRANFVERAEDWAWGPAQARQHSED